MKTKAEESVQVIEAEITGDRIETLVRCLRRFHLTFGSDDELFSFLEEVLLADQPDQIRYEVESQFYQSLEVQTKPPVAPQHVNRAWLLD